VKVVRVVRLAVVRVVKDRRVLLLQQSHPVLIPPTSAPTSAPTSVPTTCQRSCTDDTFEVTSDLSGETDDTFEVTSNLSGEQIYRFGFGTLTGGATYDGNMIENDNLCGDEVQIINYFVDSGLFCSNDLFSDCFSDLPTDTLYLFNSGPTTEGFPFTVRYELNNGLECAMTVTILPAPSIEKGESEGIGFDPRAFELDEEEDLDFLMSMSMSM